MGKNIFITGDRSNAAVYVPLVAVEIMKALNTGATITTGDSENGVERVVREFAMQAGLEVNTILNEYGTDFDARHETLKDTFGDTLEVVAIHGAPEASRVVKSLWATFDNDETVRLVTPLDLVM